MASAFYSCINSLSAKEKYILSKHFDKYISKCGDCHPWQGRTDKDGYGELRIKFRGSRICLKAHRVVFALSNPHLVLKSSSDVSHLCHNRQCVNLQHLSYEPHSVNNNRMPCKLDGECSGHHGFQDCHM